MNEVVTSDISKFGKMELKEFKAILEAYLSGNVSGRFDKEFELEELNVSFNTHSGFVFLSNSEYQVAMINPETGKLDMWYCCPYCGYEGFIQDIEHCPEDEECKEFLKQVLEGE